MRTTSLRLRVVVAVLAVLVAVLVGLGLLVNAILAARLSGDLRERLTERAGFARLIAPGLSDQELADRLTGQGISAAVKDGSSEVYGRSRPERGPGPPRGGPRPPTPAANASISDDGRSITATVPLTTRTLTLQASRVEIDRTLAQLRAVELLAGAVTVLVAGLILLRVVGGALAPLDRMTALAGRIAGGGRGERLRPTKPDTDLGRTAVAFDGMLDALETSAAEARAAEGQARAAEGQARAAEGQARAAEGQARAAEEHARAAEDQYRTDEADARQAQNPQRPFLGDASHDLRTPVAGVLAASESILRDDPGRAERERRLVAMIREARRAGRLVDDLLLMTRLDGPSARAEPVDLAEVAEEVAAGQRLLAPDADIRADTTPAWTSGDRAQLARALTNLTDNARRAAGPTGRIRVSVRNGDGVRVEVSDDGPGVPADRREEIFDRFVRYGGDGHGLGLPIARAVARRHGGDLTCEKDSTFVLTLPGTRPTRSPLCEQKA